MHPSAFPLLRTLIVCSKMFVPFAEEKLCDSLPCINLLHYYRYDLSAVFSPRKGKKKMTPLKQCIHISNYFINNKICFVLFFLKAEYSLSLEDAICLRRCPQCPSLFQSVTPNNYNVLLHFQAEGFVFYWFFSFYISSLYLMLTFKACPVKETAALLSIASCRDPSQLRMIAANMCHKQRMAATTNPLLLHPF